MLLHALSDRELVTLAESNSRFQEDGLAREVLLRLAHHAGHALASSDTRRVTSTIMPARTIGGRHARYNGRG